MLERNAKVKRDRELSWLFNRVCNSSMIYNRINGNIAFEEYNSYNGYFHAT